MKKFFLLNFFISLHILVRKRYVKVLILEKTQLDRQVRVTSWESEEAEITNKPNFMKLKDHMSPKPILIYLPYLCQTCILTTNPKPRESSALQNKLRWEILIKWTFIN